MKEPGARGIVAALFVPFFRREATTRYLGSVTGLALALVHPIALLAVCHVVCTSIFRATGFAGSWFLAFVALVLRPWLAAQVAVQRAAVCAPGCAGLIRKVAFPHEVVVQAPVAATLALHFAGCGVVLAALRAIGEPVHLEGLLLAIPLWAVMATAVAGIALALAPRDVVPRGPSNRGRIRL